MGRARRIDIEGGVYHVMNRGVARQDTFLCDIDRVEFGRLLGVGHERHGVWIHAYCLMSNHFHLLLECPTGGLSDFMHGLASVYVRHLNDRTGRDGPLFRGRFHSIAITDDGQMLATARYIHRNPLDLPGVDEPAGYRWSSHRTYLGLRRRPPWLRTETGLGISSSDPMAFDRFVADGARAPSSAGLSVPPAVLVRVVEMVLDEFADRLGTSRQGVSRTVLLLIADRLNELEAASVLGQLGSATPESTHASIRRARRRAADDPVLWAVVERVMVLAVHDVPGTS